MQIIHFKGDIAGRHTNTPYYFDVYCHVLPNVVSPPFSVIRFRKYSCGRYSFHCWEMILGPLVQLHAFGEAWAGIPFAWDLTDNKTLIAFLFWILAMVMNRKKERPGYVIVASLVILIIYSIPHSMYGSQLDPESGKIIQGAILHGIFSI